MVLTKEEKDQIKSDLGKAENDSGSTEVQVGLLTERIKYLTDHMKAHHKDKHTELGLRKLVSKRQRLMNYLKRRDAEGYEALRTKLGLRK